MSRSCDAGTNKVKVRIGNEDVLAYDQLPSAPKGYIGVLSQFNWGRFDDVKVTPVVFRAGFGTGVSVTTPQCVGPAGAPPAEKTYQLNLTGTESATGTVWPAAFWGAPSAVLMNTILQCDKTFDNYLEGQSRSILSPYLTDSSNKVLSNTVKDVTTQANGNKTRLGLGYGPEGGGQRPESLLCAAISEVLVRVWHLPALANGSCNRSSRAAVAMFHAV